MPQTFSVYDLKKISKSSRPKRLTTQSSTLRSGLIGASLAFDVARHDPERAQEARASRAHRRA